MTDLNKAVLLLLMVIISFSLLIVACIERERLSDGEKATLILTSILFLFGVLVLTFNC